MTATVSRDFIRGRHAVALAVIALVCLGALAGALHAAARYERIAQSFAAIDTAEKAVERVLVQVEIALSARDAPGSALLGAVAHLEARVAAVADGLDAHQPKLAADLRHALTQGALAGFLGAAGALSVAAAASEPLDARALHALAHGPVTDVFASVRDRLTGEHAAFGREVRTFGLVGLGALALTLGGIAVVVLRPMERRILATQAALARETERAQAAERRQGALLAQTSHEIRTSLSGVIGMSELLARTELEAKQAEYLGLMRASGATLLRIINDVLDYSKLAAGEMTFERRPLAPAEVIGATVGLFAPQFAARGVALGFESAQSAAAPVLGDAVRLRQVVTNLLSNAAKYTPQGAVTVRLSGGVESGTLRLEVEDTGEGIPPEKVGLVFESWRQLDSTATDQSRGAGLGLALTRSMVEGMGGRIGVRSALGHGSTFWVELPAVAAAVAASRPIASLRVVILSEDAGLIAALASRAEPLGCAVRGVSGAIPPADAVLIDARAPDVGAQARLARAAAPGARIIAVTAESEARPLWADALLPPDASTDALRAALAPGEDHAMTAATTPDPAAAAAAESLREMRRMAAAVADGRPPRVLLADDNDVNRMIAETLLAQLGCVVETAQDGAEAVRAARAGGFDVILMDVSMPVMNGLDATRAIRAHERERGRRTPIVALTAHALEEHLDRCLDAGMDGRLVKPFRPDDLGRTIAHFLARSADAASGAEPGAAAG